ncbi:fad dependent oxidoreductase, partial [Moniliophthora roreri]
HSVPSDYDSAHGTVYGAQYWNSELKEWPHLDAVIIGSGFSGTLTAFELLSSPNEPQNIVLFEAREACSGATGRNAGHCRPDAFCGFTISSGIHGIEQAYKILEHGKLALQLVKAFIDKHGIECDIDLCKTFDVAMAAEFGEYVRTSWGEYVKVYGKDGGVEGVRVLGAEEARKPAYHQL